jgi:hypothetical protein
MGIQKYRLSRIDVRFGSKADMCNAPTHVRFTPDSDRESRYGTNGHVRFTPKSRHVRCTISCLLWATSARSFDEHIDTP